MKRAGLRPKVERIGREKVARVAVHIAQSSRKQPPQIDSIRYFSPGRCIQERSKGIVSRLGCLRQNRYPLLMSVVQEMQNED